MNLLDTSEIKKIKKSTMLILICSVIGFVGCLLLLLPQIRESIIILIENNIFNRTLNHSKWLLRLLKYAMLGIFIIAIFNFLYFSQFGNKIVTKLLFAYPFNSFLKETEEKRSNRGCPFLNTISNNIFPIIGLCVIFLCLFVFFIVVHPIIPWETDDWSALSGFRSAVPGIGWIPGRMFSEAAMSIIGTVAAFLVYPLTGDYIYSIILTTGCTLVISCAVFYWFLYRLLYCMCKNKYLATLGSLMLFVLYFLIFKTRPESLHLLWAMDLIYFVFYGIPNILCSTLVCFFLRKYYENKDITLKSFGVYKMSILCMVIYFASFSIVFSVSILASCAFFVLVFSVFRHIKHWKHIMLNNRIYIFIIILFLIYMYFETTGPRAQGATSISRIISANYLLSIVHSLNNFLKLIIRTHLAFIGCTLLFIFSAFILYIRQEEKDEKFKQLSLLCCFSIILLSVFFILVNGISGPRQSSRPEMMYGIFFFYILWSVLSLVYTIKNILKLFILLPLLLIILSFELTNSGNRYADYWENVTPKAKIELLNKWLDQIKQADSRGEISVVIDVPENDTLNGWHEFPLPYSGRSFEITLYRHNIISKEMTIIMNPYKMQNSPQKSD
jgi:hypothetical protein